jgi:hypothetical protein
MKPEGSLLCLQRPATGSYPQPDESNLTPPHFCKNLSIISSHLHLGLFPSIFRQMR